MLKGVVCLAEVLQVLTNRTVNGLVTVEVGITGLRVLKFNRNDLRYYQQESISTQPGVYILYSEYTDGVGLIYIGESENVQQRLQQHDSAIAKNFWTHTLILQDVTGILHKANCKYIEYMLYQYAMNAGRVRVSNAVIPTKSALNMSERIKADTIVSEFLNVCVLLNIRIFEPKEVGAFEEDAGIYYLQYGGAYAKMRHSGANEYTLLKGSICIHNQGSSVPYCTYTNQSASLIKQGKARIQLDTQYYELLTDKIFDSVVEVAAFVIQADVPNVEHLWMNIHGRNPY